MSSVWPTDHREDYRYCAWPFYSQHRSFLTRCTLTNKAVWTMWRVLSKPTQRRQGPDPRPLLLLVGTPGFGPELAYRLRETQATLMDVPIYFWYTSTITLLYMFVYHIFMTFPLWLAVRPQSIRRIIYKILMCVILIARLLLLVGRLVSRKPV